MHRLAILSCVATFAVLAPLHGAVGGPDAFGYAFIDSDEPGGPTMDWEDISATGTFAFGSYEDDEVLGVSLPFTFPFYGTGYTTANISTNGNIHFGGYNYQFENGSLPDASAPAPMVAAFFDDLYMSDAGEVRYSIVTTGARHLIVQWTNVAFFFDEFSYVTFQAKLYESGLIVFNYLDMGTDYFGSGGDATVGVQNGAATVAMQYQAYGSPYSITSGLVVEFSASAPPSQPAGAVQASVSGGAAKPNDFLCGTTIFLRGTVTDPDATDTVGLQAEILPLATPFVAGITGQLATSSQVTNGGTPEASYAFTGSPYGSGAYHWRCRGIDPVGRTSAWVTPPNNRFEVDAAVPGTPTLVTPAYNAKVGAPSPMGGLLTFTWVAAPDAGPAAIDSFDIQVSSAVDFSVILKAETTTVANCALDLPSSDQLLYWRVRTSDAAGNIGPWTSHNTFRFVFESSVPPEGSGGKAGCSATTAGGGAGWAVLLILAGLLARRR